MNDISDRNRLIHQELTLARSAVRRGETLVARSHFLQALLWDSSSEVRGEYAAFLVSCGEYGNAIAEYSRMLETAENQRDYRGLIDISWQMAKAYWEWGEVPQAAYFIDYAVLLEARLLVHHQTGRELQEGFPRQLGQISHELGRQLLVALAAGNETQEGISWMFCGILEWLQGDSLQSLRSFRTGLEIARKLDQAEPAASLFLWMGRVCHDRNELRLGQFLLRRSAAWGLDSDQNQREFELAVREQVARIEREKTEA